MPKVSRPPISGYLSNTTGVTPPRASTSAQARPAGPAPMTATRLPVLTTLEVGLPAHLERLVGDVFFDVADGDGTEAIVEGAGTLTQSVLRADPATHLRQAVGLVGELHRLQNASLVGQLQPVGDVVVDRALPLAVRVAAVEATIRLHADLGLVEGLVDLHELDLADLERLLGRVDPLHVDKLKYVLAHRVPSLLRLDSEFCTGTAGVTKQRFDVAGLGFDQPELGHIGVEVGQDLLGARAAGFVECAVMMPRRCS